MNVVATTPVATPAPPLPNGNISHVTVALTPALDQGTRDAMKRLKAIEKAGKMVRDQELAITKQETVCGNLKANLDDEKDTLSEMRRELKDFQEDLAKLSTGGFSERLAFNAKPEKSGATATPVNTAPFPADWEQAAQAAFDGVSLKDIGITGALKDKLEADGIRNGKQLREFMQSHPPRLISGVGESARSKLNDTMMDWYTKYEKTNPRPAVKAAGAVDKVPLAQAMGEKKKTTKRGTRQKVGKKK
jgi:hypothetical protein